MKVIFKPVMIGISVSKSFYCNFHSDASLVDDVLWHLQRLLICHQQSYALFPDLGMPELEHAYQSLQATAWKVQKNIEILIKRYEPRLQQLSVTPLKNSQSTRLCFQVEGRLKKIKQQFAVFVGDTIVIKQVQYD